MDACLILGLVSAAIGVLVAKKVTTFRAIPIAGALAWFAFLAIQLLCEYVLPYQGGGASMWPIAQIIGGTLAAFVAGTAALLTLSLSPEPPDESS